MSLTILRDWTNGSVVKSTGYSVKGPGFNPQHPHVGSQPSVTLVLGDLTLSSPPLNFEVTMHTGGAQIYTHTKHTYAG